MLASPMPKPLEMSDEMTRGNPTLDYTTPDLVSLVVSDLGVMTPSVRQLSQYLTRDLRVRCLHHFSLTDPFSTAGDIGFFTCGVWRRVVWEQIVESVSHYKRQSNSPCLSLAVLQICFSTIGLLLICKHTGCDSDAIILIIARKLLAAPGLCYTSTSVLHVLLVPTKLPLSLYSISYFLHPMVKDPL